jgi:hypothetical protein
MHDKEMAWMLLIRQCGAGLERLGGTKGGRIYFSLS